MREYRHDTSSGANDRDYCTIAHAFNTFTQILYGRAIVGRPKFSVTACLHLGRWPTNYKFTTIGITQPPKDFLERATFRGDSLSIVSFVRLSR